MEKNSEKQRETLHNSESSDLRRSFALCTIMLLLIKKIKVSLAPFVLSRAATGVVVSELCKTVCCCSLRL